MRTRRLIAIVLTCVGLTVPVTGFAQSDFQTPFKAAAAALDKNDYDTAITNFSAVKAAADYEKAVALDAKDAEAFYKRGNVRVMRKEYDGAIADYDKALQLDPSLASAKANREIAIQRKGTK